MLVFAVLFKAFSTVVGKSHFAACGPCHLSCRLYSWRCANLSVARVATRARGLFTLIVCAFSTINSTCFCEAFDKLSFSNIQVKAQLAQRVINNRTVLKHHLYEFMLEANVMHASPWIARMFTYRPMCARVRERAAQASFLARVCGAVVARVLCMHKAQGSIPCSSNTGRSRPFLLF